MTRIFHVTFFAIVGTASAHAGFSSYDWQEDGSVCVQLLQQETRLIAATLGHSDANASSLDDSEPCSSNVNFLQNDFRLEHDGSGLRLGGKASPGLSIAHGNVNASASTLQVGNGGTLHRNMQIGVKTSSHMSRSFAITCCVLGAIVMFGFRMIPRLVDCGRLICVADVAVWYILTSCNLASAQELLQINRGPVVVVVALVQVFAGITILPFGDVMSLGRLSWHYMLIILLCGSIFFFYGFFFLESLSRGGIMLVSNIRALEPFSTTAIMVLFAGAAVSCVQYFAIIGAVVGVIVASPFAGDELVNNLLVVALILFSNLLNSLRNVLLHQSSELGFTFKCKMSVFALCSCMALPAGISMLVIHQVVDYQPIVVNSMFPDRPLLVISIVSFVLYNLASFLVLMRVKPVTHVVLLAGKRVVTTWLACALAGEMPATIEIIGMCITTICVYVFEISKPKHEHELAQEAFAAPAKDGQPEKNSEKKPNMIKQLLLWRSGVGIVMCLLIVTSLGLAVFVQTF